MATLLEPLPPLEAMEALRRRGLTLDPSFAWQDRWQEDHAAMFTVAKSTGFDILKDIHTALEASLAEGSTFRDFSRSLTPVLQEKGWWGRANVLDPETGEPTNVQLGSTRRLQTIFDVNMRVSYAAGHWSNFERNKSARPFLRYVAIRDERTRPSHMARHNLVLPVDHPYWDVWAPPCGWNCRCTLQSLSQRDVDRMIAEGVPLSFDPPALDMREWTNRRTGEVQSVPEGIDPGWAYNPGKAGWRSGLAQADKIADAPPELAALLEEEPDWLLRPLGAEFAEWFDQAAAGGRMERTTVVAGALSREVLAGLEGRDIRPASGAITVEQKQVRHMIRELKEQIGNAAPVEILRTLPQLLAQPRAVVVERSTGNMLYVFDVPGEARFGKLAVHVNYSRKVRPPMGKRQTVVTNSVRSASLVSRDALRNGGAYDILFGSL